MKPRSGRSMGGEPSGSRAKSESLLANGPAASQQSSAQVIRKRRSSINVYDQPSSLNARLRQLETDMLRLDEDRTKLFDDTHSSLAQYEIRLSEIQSILRSRQDNVEKYVEEMKVLLAAKEDFEKQAKSLNEKHERMQEKFMHRETTISRDIKLLKSKFELLEKNRQFRSIFQKSNPKSGDTSSNQDGTSATNTPGVLPDAATASKRVSEEQRTPGAGLAAEQSSQSSRSYQTNQDQEGGSSPRRAGFFARILDFFRNLLPRPVLPYAFGYKSNRIASIVTTSAVSNQLDEPQASSEPGQEATTNNNEPNQKEPSVHSGLANEQVAAKQVVLDMGVTPT